MFHNGKSAEPLCITLNGLGFQQQPTQIKTDKSNSKGIITITLRKKDPRQWIWYLIGWRNDWNQMFFNIRNQYAETWLITLQNITHHITIKNVLYLPIHVKYHAKDQPYNCSRACWCPTDRRTLKATNCNVSIWINNGDIVWRADHMTWWSERIMLPVWTNKSH